MAELAQASTRRSYVWGPLSLLGLGVALFTGIADQASKLWLMYVFDLQGRVQINAASCRDPQNGVPVDLWCVPGVPITSYLDLVVAWNRGISYGLFQQQDGFGVWALLAFKVVALVLLWVWLARVSSRLTAVALGLIVGGAIGNVIDGLHWKGVMDFVLLHTPDWGFKWYVFNLADVAIVAGVVGLLYDLLRVGSPQKRPDPG